MTALAGPSSTWTSVRTGPGRPQGEESFFAIADILALLCGGPVVVHDAGWQLLAHSGGDHPDEVRMQTVLGRRAPQATVAQLRDLGVVDRLVRGEIVHLPAGEIAGLGERWTAAVLVDGELLGSIWVMPGHGMAEPDLRDGLRRGVGVAALALLRRAAATGQCLDQDLALAALLGGRPTQAVVARQLGTAVDGGFVLAGLRPLASEPAERAAAARRLLGLVRSYCGAYRVTAMAALVGDTVAVLFPCRDAGDRSEILRVTTGLQQRLHPTVAHRVLLGSGFTHLNGAVTARPELDELLDLAEQRNWPGLIDAETVRAARLLARFREAALADPALREGPARLLTEHDRTHGSDLVTTLRTYFDTVGDVAATARRLRIHVNTVRYRLRRGQEIAGLRLDDPDDRLLAELQLRLLSDE